MTWYLLIDMTWYQLMTYLFVSEIMAEITKMTLEVYKRF